MTERSTVGWYLGELRRTLEPAPRRRRARLLTEAEEHLRDLVAEQTAQGVEPADAETAALRRFGDVHEVGHQLLLTALVSEERTGLYGIFALSVLVHTMLAAIGLFEIREADIAGYTTAGGLVSFAIACTAYHTYVVLAARGNEPTVDVLERKLQARLRISGSDRWLTWTIGTLLVAVTTIRAVSSFDDLLADPVRVGGSFTLAYISFMLFVVVWSRRVVRPSYRQSEERAARLRQLVSSSD